MCFYIYAPNRRISVPYVSESIFLKKNGGSTVGTDCLIENPPSPSSDVSSQSEEDKISSIRIIYPNNLFTNSLLGRILRYKKFYNLTNTLEDDFKEGNRFSLMFGKIQQTDNTIKPFSLPNPKDGTETTIDGFIDTKGNDELSIDCFQPTILDALRFTNYSILTYEFEHPIEKGESRLIRLLFNSTKTAKIHQLSQYVLLRKFTNSLSYRYHICGPLNIRENFLEELHLCRVRATTKKSGEKIKRALTQLHNATKNEGLFDKKRETTYKNLAITIEREGAIAQISDMKSSGNIEPFGDRPDIWIRRERYRDCYRWYSPKKISKPEETLKSMDFAICFKAKPFKLPYLLLPLIALTIAFSGLILTVLINFHIIKVQ